MNLNMHHNTNKKNMTKEQHKEYYTILTEMWKMFIRDSTKINDKQFCETLEEYADVAKFYRDSPYASFACGLSSVFMAELTHLKLTEKNNG